MRLAKSIRQDLRVAKSKWCDLNKPLLDSLVGALRRHRLSLAGGDLLLLDGRWYVTHSGLLRIAVRKHCQGPDGLFLVRVERAQYRWHAQKPYYLLRFVV